MKIAARHGKIGIELAVDENVREIHVVFAQDEGVFHDLIDLHGSALGLVLTREAEQALNDVMGALRLLLELVDVVRAAILREIRWDCRSWL